MFEDLHMMMGEFYDGGNLTPINYSWIFLIPKKDGTNELGNFRPISLATCSYKIVSKILVNMLK